MQMQETIICTCTCTFVWWSSVIRTNGVKEKRGDISKGREREENGREREKRGEGERERERVSSLNHLPLCPWERSVFPWCKWRAAAHSPPVSRAALAPESDCKLSVNMNSCNMLCICTGTYMYMYNVIYMQYYSSYCEALALYLYLYTCKSHASAECTYTCYSMVPVQGIFPGISLTTSTRYTCTCSCRTSGHTHSYNIIEQNPLVA